VHGKFIASTHRRTHPNLWSNFSQTPHSTGASTSVLIFEFFIFLQIKNALTGKRFEDAETVKLTATKQLLEIPNTEHELLLTVEQVYPRRRVRSQGKISIISSTASVRIHLARPRIFWATNSTVNETTNKYTWQTETKYLLHWIYIKRIYLSKCVWSLCSLQWLRE